MSRDPSVVSLLEDHSDPVLGCHGHVLPRTGTVDRRSGLGTVRRREARTLFRSPGTARVERDGVGRTTGLLYDSTTRQRGKVLTTRGSDRSVLLTVLPSLRHFGRMSNRKKCN